MTSKDGWHRVYSYDVWVEKGKVLRACDENHTKTLYPYKNTKYGCTNYSGLISLDYFRTALKLKNIVLM